jgi:hypothetical protein
MRAGVQRIPDVEGVIQTVMGEDGIKRIVAGGLAGAEN